MVASLSSFLIAGSRISGPPPERDQPEVTSCHADTTGSVERKAGFRCVAPRGSDLPPMRLAADRDARPHGSSIVLPLWTVPCPLLSPSEGRRGREVGLTLRPSRARRRHRPAPQVAERRARRATAGRGGRKSTSLNSS